MNRRSRIFLTVLFALASAFGAVLIDGTRHGAPTAASRVVALTRLPDAALAVPYCEPRWRSYADYSTTTHPELPPLSNLGFVYER
jgi:hypothetical protein